MKTYTPKGKEIERAWWLMDADGVVLGRLASEIAKILRGKHKPTFAPHIDTGDHVVVINASRVRLTGAKLQQKLWYRHSGYPGGLREIPYERILKERPEMAIEKAVKGMLPKNRLAQQMIKKLKVYAGDEHPHAPQNPVKIKVGAVPGAGA